MESVTPKFDAFHSINSCNRSDPVFPLFIWLQRWGDSLCIYHHTRTVNQLGQKKLPVPTPPLGKFNPFATLHFTLLSLLNHSCKLENPSYHFFAVGKSIFYHGYPISKIILHSIISVVWLTNFLSEIWSPTIPWWWGLQLFLSMKNSMCRWPMSTAIASMIACSHSILCAYGDECLLSGIWKKYGWK